MPAFDLARFRELAFGRPPLPDHPLRSLEDAQRVLAQLADGDAERNLIDLTHWSATMNAAEEFSPGRRAVVLMLLDDTARPMWRELGMRYLAPAGSATEGRDGDADILHALFDSASEFATGFALALDVGERESKWVQSNLARLIIRNMRWLSRRLALAYMLHLPHVASIWERLHRLHGVASLRGVDRTAIPAYEGGSYHTSAMREYMRALLFELANPGGLSARNVELAYRIVARTAIAARFENAPSAEANFAVVPLGDRRPGPVRLLAPARVPPLYINTTNCLGRLRDAAERDMGRDPTEEDSMYGRGFTLRERRAMLQRLIEHWGLDPPQRRARRIPMAARSRIVAGFDNVLGVLLPLEGSAEAEAPRAPSDLRLKLEENGNGVKRARARAARVGPARVVDASTGGLGVAISRADAPWALHGALLAVLIEPGAEWILGVLRRIFTVDEELRLGIQVLAAKPRRLTLRTETVKRDQVWEDAMRFEATFREIFRHGILLEAQNLPLAGGQILLPPGLASRGTHFNVPLPQGEQFIAVTRLVEEGEHFQRAVFEPLGVER